jgi:hypothetical protein
VIETETETLAHRKEEHRIGGYHAYMRVLRHWYDSISSIAMQYIEPISTSSLHALTAKLVMLSSPSYALYGNLYLPVCEHNPFFLTHCIFLPRSVASTPTEETRAGEKVSKSSRKSNRNSE